MFTSFQLEPPTLGKVGYPLCFDNDPFCLFDNSLLLITIWIAYVRALPARILGSIFATLCQERKTSPVFSITCALSAQNAGVCIRRDTRVYPNLPLPQGLFPQGQAGTGDGPAPSIRHSPRTPLSPSTSVLHSPGSFLYLLSYCPPARPHIDWPFNRGGFPLTGSERRTTQRFSMRLPLTVRWTTGAAVGETSTESRDVSSRGVYFYLAKDVKEGSAVEILLTLPNEITLAGPVRVRCLGRVQRTEPRDESSVGVVAAIERYEFLRGDDDN